MISDEKYQKALQQKEDAENIIKAYHGQIPHGVCHKCRQPLPRGEEMFKYHGYSGDCPTDTKKESQRAPKRVGET